MKNFLKITAFLVALFVSAPAFAVCGVASSTCFWVGGTGTWDNSTATHWASSSNGPGGVAVPLSTDAVIFDANSGSGTVTVAATINGTNTVTSITCGAMASLTLDLSANNPSLTMGSFSATGTGTARAVNLGTGTLTLTSNNANVWDAGTATGLTLTASSSTIVIANLTFFGGSNFNSATGLTYGTLSLAPVSGETVSIQGSAGFTIGHLNITAPVAINVNVGFTISNAVTWSGTSANLIVLASGGTSTPSITFSAAGNTASWIALRNITFATNNLVANNSFNMGTVTNATVNNPIVGGGSRCIGC